MVDMSTFDKAKKKVKEAAEKTEEEAKEAGGKIKSVGKKGVKKPEKLAMKRKKN
jgi:hypothetical protein